MAKQKNPEIVQEEIARINKDQGSKLVAFNPQTGELEVVDTRNEVSPEATIMTDVINGGFAKQK